VKMMMYVGIKKKLEKHLTKVGMGTFELKTESVAEML
jgi:hypothetical protein